MNGGQGTKREKPTRKVDKEEKFEAPVWIKSKLALGFTTAVFKFCLKK